MKRGLESSRALKCGYKEISTEWIIRKRNLGIILKSVYNDKRMNWICFIRAQ